MVETLPPPVELVEDILPVSEPSEDALNSRPVLISNDTGEMTVAQLGASGPPP